MKKYKVDYTNAARKIINKLDDQIKTRIKNWINNYLEGCENPRFQGKALTGKFAGKWRYRVGNYRIIAEIQDDKIVILIVDVDKRNDIYKN